MDRMPQFGLVEEYFNLALGVEVLRARYDRILKIIDSEDPADAGGLEQVAREVGVSDPEVEHFFEHWIGEAGDGSGKSHEAYFPEFAGDDIRREFVSGAVAALRAARAYDLPLACVLVTGAEGFRVRHVVTGPAVIVLFHVPFSDDILRLK